MFTILLNQKEREGFFELANLVARCNSDFDDKENVIIKSLEITLSLKDYKLADKNLDQIIEDFTETSSVTKFAILLELLSLVLADCNYDGKEQEVIRKIKEAWIVSEEQFKSVLAWLQKKDIIFKAEKTTE